MNLLIPAALLTVAAASAMGKKQVPNELPPPGFPSIDPEPEPDFPYAVLAMNQNLGSAPPSAVGYTYPGDKKRWYFWYTRKAGSSSFVLTHPEYMSDYQAFILQTNTKAQNPGVEMWRFLYDPAISKTNWVYDRRNDPQLMAGDPLPTGSYA